MRGSVSLFNLLDSLIRKEEFGLYDAEEVSRSGEACRLEEKRRPRGIRVENPNCRTKLPRNQVYGNPRAFEDFATIVLANYVSDVSRYV